MLTTSTRSHYETTSLADQFLKHTNNIETKVIFHFSSEIYNKFNGYIGTFSLFSDRLYEDTSKCHEIIKEFYLDIKQEVLFLYNISLFALQKHDYSSAIDILLGDIEKNDIILSPQALW
ncbi:MAG: hypothetical protein RSA84_17405, partial [Acinetobacter sp.]